MRRGESGINALLGIDKPVGMTSHDVVNCVRRAVGERRVGHAGTLDPAASGVLVVGIGQGTRLMGYLTAERKSYRATIAFGHETDTDDVEGLVTRVVPTPDRVGDHAYATDLLDSLVGEQDQVPPAYSAISVGGRRSYDRARAGEVVSLPARRVEVFSACLLGIGSVDGVIRWDCVFTVSKGTYIRSLARDIGRATGGAAHLEALRRTSSGAVALSSCIALQEDVRAATSPQEVLAHALDPLRALGAPARRVDAAELADVSCGRRIMAGVIVADGVERAPHHGEQVALVSDSRLYGIWECTGGQLSCTVNFPQGIMGVRG